MPKGKQAYKTPNSHYKQSRIGIIFILIKISVAAHCALENRNNRVSTIKDRDEMSTNHDAANPQKRILPPPPRFVLKYMGNNRLSDYFPNRYGKKLTKSKPGINFYNWLLQSILMKYQIPTKTNTSEIQRIAKRFFPRFYYLKRGSQTIQT